MNQKERDEIKNILLARDMDIIDGKQFQKCFENIKEKYNHES